MLKPKIINNLKDNKKFEKLFFEVQEKRFTCQCDCQTGGYTIKEFWSLKKTEFVFHSLMVHILALLQLWLDY